MITYNGYQYECTEMGTEMRLDHPDMEMKRIRIQVWDMEGVVQYDKDEIRPTHRFTINQWGERRVDRIVRSKS